MTVLLTESLVSTGSLVLSSRFQATGPSTDDTTDPTTLVATVVERVG